MRSTFGSTIRQRNLHDRIIRIDDELNRIREYIENNPADWDTEKNNPKSSVRAGPRARPDVDDEKTTDEFRATGNWIAPARA